MPLSRYRRRTLLIACSLLLASVSALWTATLWRRVSCRISLTPEGDATYIRLENGRVGIQRSSIWAQEDIERILVVTPHARERTRWWFEREITPWPFSPRVYWLPLWCAAAPLALTAAWTIRTGTQHRRRLRRGQCTACGYNRTGLPQHTNCPECGVPANHPTHTR